MPPREPIDVLHFIGSLGAGGAERNLCYLAPWMAKSKLRYGICCLLRKGELAAEIEALGLPVFDLGFRRRRALSTIWALRCLLREHRVMVIHTHLFECGVLGRVAAWFAGTPVRITHEHGKTMWKKWYHRLFERLAIRGTDLRIAVSADIRNLRLAEEHTHPAKIVVVGNAVEPSGFDLPETVRGRMRSELGLGSQIVVGTVGRLVEAKAYDFLMEVAAIVCAARPDVRFVLVGKGHLERDLLKLRDSLGLADRVTFLGARSDIPEILSAVDIYVITSRREGLPITLLEAMMAAKPVIATSIGGIPEVLEDRGDGILVPSGDRQAMADAILALAADPGRRDALGRRAREKAIARYSARAILETLEATYASILGGKGRDWSRPGSAASGAGAGNHH
jgi:glycosyltransferase involved in cell wall biosynthesis